MMRFFCVITCRSVLNAWPKTTLLPVWPRDVKRLDTPAELLKWCVTVNRLHLGGKVIIESKIEKGVESTATCCIPLPDPFSVLPERPYSCVCTCNTCVCAHGILLCL